jgi:hypothetical protein
MFSLSYYVPQSDHERIKQALFDKGAGKIGAYDECCWEVLGAGQFRANTGSSPAIGKIDQLMRLQEYKVEMVCTDECVREVVETLLKEHPYEQPAYFINRVMTLDDLL